MVTAPVELWVGKKAPAAGAGESSVTEPGQPPSVTLRIAQAAKPRASDATELVDFVPAKAAAAVAPLPNAVDAKASASLAPRAHSGSGVVVLLVLLAAGLVLWRVVAH